MHDLTGPEHILQKFSQLLQAVAGRQRAGDDRRNCFSFKQVNSVRNIRTSFQIILIEQDNTMAAFLHPFGYHFRDLSVLLTDTGRRIHQE